MDGPVLKIVDGYCSEDVNLLALTLWELGLVPGSYEFEGQYGEKVLDGLWVMRMVLKGLYE